MGSSPGIALGIAITAPRAVVPVRRSLVASGSSQDGFPLKKIKTIKKVLFLSQLAEVVGLRIIPDHCLGLRMMSGERLIDGF